VTSQSRKHRGYKSQDIVAEYLAKHGFPYAMSTGAGRTGTDVTGVIGHDIEVKARRGFNVMAAMRQQAERAAEGVLSWAVLRQDGQGPASIAEWPVVITLGQFVELLRDAGHGDPRA
jgi:hypothetical protein